MIKENEIRIGNTFYFPFHKQNVSIIGYAKIEKDDSFKVQFETNGGILLEPLSVLKPIALTEELLFKYGFEIDDDFGDEKFYQIPNIKKGFGVCNDHDVWSLYAYFGVGGNNYHTLLYDENYFIYLHQLQNLWFCLTGKELSVVENGS